MSYLAPLPAGLQRVEYVRLYFHLQISAGFDLPQLGLLHLRRELQQALGTLAGWGDAAETGQLKVLLQPPVPVDPLLRRQVQKPAPAFVLTPDPQIHGQLNAQQSIVLPALFIGSGIAPITGFIALLQQLGQQGLYHGHGQFCLEAVESEDASGVRAMLWTDGNAIEPLTPPVSDLLWLLERQMLAADKLLLEVISPLRLLRQQKPLFKADFAALFPFVLRRVSAMLSYHGGVELIKNPDQLIAQAQQVEVYSNSLQWRDWRNLSGTEQQEIGGLLGQLQLGGSALVDLLWVLQLGSLFNVGKGAAYGAGQYRLERSC